MLSFLLLGTFLIHTQAQSSNVNIYGYDYNSNSASSGPFLVQNPNYQFLNDQLANEYAQSYQEEVQQYDQSAGTSSGSGTGSSNSNSNGFVTSSSYVPTLGYYTGPALSNQQQNQVNYQQILQQNPSSNTAYSSSSSGSTNIYGYGYSSGSTSGTGSSSSTYNNNYQYSAPTSTSSQPYIYPFGQYAASTASPTTTYTNNQVFYDQSGNSSPDSTPTGNSYTLFDQPQLAVTGYQSASDLKTTRLRDQPPMNSEVTLLGTGPMPGPTIGSGTITGGDYTPKPTSTNSKIDSQSNNAMYSPSTSASNNYQYTNTNSYNTYQASNTNANMNTNTNTNTASNTAMYYPYRTLTNVPQTTNYYSGAQYDSAVTTLQQTPSGTCTSEADMCSEYVSIFISSRIEYMNDTTQTACQALANSLRDSVVNCCLSYRNAGCTQPLVTKQT